MHSSRKVIKLEEWEPFFRAMPANPEATTGNVRYIYENDDIIILHSIGIFPNGSKHAVMHIGLL
ncbi:hypothetical protein N9P21_00235 [Rhodobacteraceae bacterium]|nr:hypothetical protein [Paracoccaceae bacterium]